MRLLIVDDNGDVRGAIAEGLRRMGHEVATAASGPEALERLNADAVDVAIVDIRMPGMDGLDVLRALKRARHPVGIIMLTGQDDVEEAVQAHRLGADDYLAKPVRVADLDRLLARVATAERRYPDEARA
jgi:DNA-binding response OmpR family regulator